MSATKKILGMLCLLMAATTQASKMLHNPLRVRLNSELIKQVFHKKDQDLLNVLHNIPLGDFALGANEATIKGLSVSLEPVEGVSHDEFNYRLSLDQETFLGIEADELYLRGTGQIVHAGSETGEEFTLEGPVSGFRVAFEVKEVPESSETAKQSKKIDFKSIDFTLVEETTVVKSASALFQEHGHAAELKKWVREQLSAALLQIKDDAFLGKDTVLAKLPALSLAPMVGLYFAAFGADRMHFTDEFIEYEFSPVSLKLVKQANLYEEFLKEIDTAFAPMQDGEESSALQLIVDQNIVNGFIGQFLKIEKTWSLRDLLSLDPRLAVMKQLLTTTTIGMVVPSFKEEYGENRPLNVVLTASHDFMTSGLGGDVTPTGIQIDANGNFQVTANLGMQLIVENKDNVQEEARAVYVQLALKGKMFVADAQHDNRTFVVLPKSLTMPVFKVMNSAGEEQFLEQMLVQSMVGFQLENLKKAFQPVVFPLKKFHNPPESQCLGFNLTNVNIKVNKGFLQINGGYIKIAKEDVDQAFCADFEERIAKSPQDIFKKLTENPIFDNPMAGKMFKAAQDELDSSASKREAKAHAEEL